MRQRFNRHGQPIGIQYGYVNMQEQFVIPPQFEHAFHFQEGRARVSERGRWYFIDHSGTRTSDTFNWVGDYCQGRAIVSREDGKRAFIDRNGEFVTGFDFDNSFRFTEDRAAVSVDGKFGFINLQGELVIPYTFEEAMPFFGGTACVKTNGKYGQIDKDGNITIPMEWERFFTFHESLASVHNGKKDGYIDALGNVLIDFQFDYAHPFSNGLARVRMGDHEGFINKAGHWVMEPRLSEAQDFHEGLAAVKMDNHWGFVDTMGNMAVPAQYVYVGSFHDGIAFARTSDRTGFIDQRGNWKIETTNEDITFFSEGLACVAVRVTQPQSGEKVRHSLEALTEHWEQLQEAFNTAEIDDRMKLEEMLEEHGRLLNAFREELFYWIDVPERSLSYEQVIVDLDIEGMIQSMDEDLLDSVKEEIEDGIRGVRGKKKSQMIVFLGESSE